MPDSGSDPVHGPAAGPAAPGGGRLLIVYSPEAGLPEGVEHRRFEGSAPLSLIVKGAGESEPDQGGAKQGDEPDAGDPGLLENRPGEGDGAGGVSIHDGIAPIELGLAVAHAEEGTDPVDPDGVVAGEAGKLGEFGGEGAEGGIGDAHQVLHRFGGQGELHPLGAALDPAGGAFRREGSEFHGPGVLGEVGVGCGVTGLDQNEDGFGGGALEIGQDGGFSLALPGPGLGVADHDDAAVGHHGQ